MKTVLLLTICLLFSFDHCNADDKTIHALVAALTHRPTQRPTKIDSSWDAGMGPIVDAPAKTNPAKVLSLTLPMWEPTELIKHYKTLAVEEQLLIPSSFSPRTRYTAVLIRSDQGKKVILMRYTGNYWFTKPFDVEDGHFRCGERVWP